jgi:hypothetical protein
MIEDIRNPYLRRAAIIAVLLLIPILVPAVNYREIAGFIRDVLRDTARDVREIW